MAKKDNDNFDFEVEGEGKAKAGLNLDFIKNLTKQQKGIILAALVGIILVIAIIVVVVIVGAGNGGNTTGGNTNSGGDNSQTGGSGDKEIIAPEASNEIYIFTQPAKLVYYVGESADYSGMVIGVSAGTKTIYYDYADYKDMFTITGFDSSAPAEEQIITVAYGEHSAEFKVKILAKTTAQSGLVSIRVDPLPKTTYTVGSAFNTTGSYIVCTYSDGTTKSVELTLENVLGYGAIAYTPGEHQIKVKYADDHGGYAETYITVTITE